MALSRTVGGFRRPFFVFRYVLVTSGLGGYEASISSVGIGYVGCVLPLLFAGYKLNASLRYQCTEGHL